MTYPPGSKILRLLRPLQISNHVYRSYYARKGNLESLNEASASEVLRHLYQRMTFTT